MRVIQFNTEKFTVSHVTAAITILEKCWSFEISFSLSGFGTKYDFCIIDVRLNLTNSGKNPVRNCHTFCGKSQNMKLSARNVDTNAEITA